MNPLIAATDYAGVVWTHHDFTHDDLTGTTFSSCTFDACDFSGVRLSGTRFEACRFVESNFSNTIVDHTRFDAVVLESCKLVGLNFGSADLLIFELSVSKCLLRYVNFSQIRWKGAVLTDCDASETDFRGAQMAGADLRRTRFRACRFSGANLEKADFSHAEGYDLDLRTENLKKAIFTLPEALNLLVPFDLDVK